MERETPEPEAPATFLRDEEAASPDSARARFERMIRRVQADVCAKLEAVEGGGGAQFGEDAWTRPGGGGGISRVLQGGRVFEKAAVNVSVVYRVMPPEAYRAARPEAAAAGGGEGRAGALLRGRCQLGHSSSEPICSNNAFQLPVFRNRGTYGPGAPRQWWFGGGTDLTPSYIIEEDVKHFHAVQKQVCDNFDPSFYPRFKKWCDDYFYIKHRGERRGVGGIFFDDLNDYDQETLLRFTTVCADSVLPAYIPIIERLKDTPFTEEHKAWQQLRRGRYVEFNLVYDRGTTFGLKTGGRIESILVSLPLTARWEYDHLFAETRSRN
ncbi:hypothetical protein BS78_07G083100 [Paspalum vaginatum]|nr:hypothetical protein BS78_07G083100 [Paspalum vaginatum]